MKRADLLLLSILLYFVVIPIMIFTVRGVEASETLINNMMNLFAATLSLLVVSLTLVFMKRKRKENQKDQ